MKTVNMQLIEFDGQEYTCYGCKGEMPVKHGDYVLTQTGEPNAPKFCIRCALALAAKNKFRKEPLMYVEYGSLQFLRLSNAFRKRWLQFAKDLHDAKADRKRQQMIIAEIQREYDFGTVTVTAPKKPHKSPEKLMQESLHKINCWTKKANKAVAEMQSAIARLHLATRLGDGAGMQVAFERMATLKNTTGELLVKILKEGNKHEKNA